MFMRNTSCSSTAATGLKAQACAEGLAVSVVLAAEARHRATAITPAMLAARNRRALGDRAHALPTGQEAAALAVREAPAEAGAVMPHARPNAHPMCRSPWLRA